MTANVTQPPVPIDTVLTQARDDVNGSHYFGPYAIGANLYAVLVDFKTSHVNVYKSTDAGLTWATLDSANRPTCDNALDVLLQGTTFHIVYLTPAPADVLKHVSFDTTTDTFGTVSADGPGNALVPRIAQFASGDFCIGYNDTVDVTFTVKLLIFSGGAWGAATGVPNVQNNITGLIIGPDNVARCLYFNQHVSPQKVLFRTFTNGGTLGAENLIFSSTYIPNATIDTFAMLPVGKSVIWNNSFIVPYYGNPVGSGKQAGVYVGTPYTAPVWTFILLNTLAVSVNEFDCYAYTFVDGDGNLRVFWISIDFIGHSASDQLNSMYYATNSGLGFGTPLLFYDSTANPPPVPGGLLHTIGAALFPNRKFGVITAINEGADCVGFFLRDSVGPKVCLQ
jgi:hypothetical protein